MSRPCQICRAADGNDITVTGDDGGVAAYICDRCRDQLHAGADCSICRGDASGEYHFITSGRDAPRTPVCADCRKMVVFDTMPPVMNRLQQMGIERFGRSA